MEVENEDIQQDNSIQSGKAEERTAEDVVKLGSVRLFEEIATKTKGIEASEKVEFSEVREKIATAVRDYVIHQIVLADTKSGLLIGSLTGLLIAVYKYGPNIFEKNLKTWQFPDVLTVAGYLTLLTSIALCMLVIWPRTGSSRKKGCICWLHVANYLCVGEYLKDVCNVTDEGLLGEEWELNYDLSLVCKSKFRCLEWAFRIGVIGIIICCMVLIKY